jgi:hypothetical protein
MKRLFTLTIILTLAASLTPTATAEPVWGMNCLSCHNVRLDDAIVLFSADGTVNPNESATGAPDRGILEFFRAPRSAIGNLEAQIAGLEPGDTYAVEIKRFNLRGVENGGVLRYTGDCDWPEWGESVHYYSEPYQAYRWGTGPDSFQFGLQTEEDADLDYYDLVYAVAGRLASTGELFYAEQHFYVQVVEEVAQEGDVDGDGDVDLSDLAALLASYGTCTGNPGFNAGADFNASGCIELADLATLLANYGEGL